MSRRDLLRLAAIGGLAACTDTGSDSAATTTSNAILPPSSTTPTTSTPSTTIPVPALGGAPFALGVASGDPVVDGVVLWTRLVIDVDAADGGMPAEPVRVRWEVADDDTFAPVVASGDTVTGPDEAHSVHIDVRGLGPGRPYAYRFIVGEHVSPIGATRTVPEPDSSPQRLRFAVANCQAYQSGFYGAHAAIAAEDVDAVLFVGDYIYELEASLAARQHDIGVPTTLEGYRRLYAVTHADADLQACHAAHPWIAMWDDHEVEDNYAADQPGGVGVATGLSSPETFMERRTAAYRAWWEHMPVRAAPPDADGAMEIHQAVQYGDLARLVVIDVRQYRSPIPEGDDAANLPRGFGGGAQVPQAFSPDATMLGAEQEAWASELLVADDVGWTVLVQPSAMAEMDRAPGNDELGFSMDGWDGYVEARRRLLEPVAEAGLGNLVSVGGDLHTSVVADLRLDYGDPASPVVGSEFVGPSVSSLELIEPEAVAGALSQDHVQLYDPDHRGYLTLELTPADCVADYRYVDALDPARPPSVVEGSRWRVEHGRPGVQPV